MRFLLAGGGTGGHIFPGLAVAEQLRRQRPSAEIVFLGTGRPLDREVIPAAGYRLVEQPVRPLPTPMKFWTVPGFLWSWFRSKRLVAAELSAPGAATDSRTSQSTIPGADADSRDSHLAQPVVLGLGGYAAGPAIRVAAQNGLPAALLNPDLLPGRANRWAEKYVSEIYAQWPESAAHFRDGRKVIATGCPLRASLTDSLAGDRSERRAALRAEAAELFGLDPARRTLLVTGASQGSRSINEALLHLAWPLERYADDWQILHLTGRAEFDAVAETVAGWGTVIGSGTARTGRRLRYRPVAFTTRMDLVYAVSDLCVGRAGASTVAELTAVGLPSVLLPYPHHADEHQRHNAEVLVAAEAARLIRDQLTVEANANELLPVLRELMGSPERLAEAAAAARRIGRPNAAADIASRLIALAESRSE